MWNWKRSVTGYISKFCGTYYSTTEENVEKVRYFLSGTRRYTANYYQGSCETTGPKVRKCKCLPPFLACSTSSSFSPDYPSSFPLHSCSRYFFKYTSYFFGSTSLSAARNSVFPFNGTQWSLEPCSLMQEPCAGWSGSRQKPLQSKPKR